MTETSAPQTCKPQLHTEEGDGAPPEASKRAEAVTVSKAEQSEVPQWKPAFSNSPSHILNTTLDLLDNSDTELQAEPEIKMESVIHSNIYAQYVVSQMTCCTLFSYTICIACCIHLRSSYTHRNKQTFTSRRRERKKKCVQCVQYITVCVVFVSDLSSNDSPDIRFF